MENIANLRKLNYKKKIGNLFLFLLSLSRHVLAYPT